MKRLGMILMAGVMVLGFTQCKKEQAPANTETEGVHITLTVDGGSNSSKVAVNPNASEGYATVAFETGDIIYVGNNGAYCGYLTHNGTNFSGTVTPTSEADYLHFYFMGNKGPADSEPTSVSITDQTGKYPVISYAHSTVLYNSGVNTYSAKLQNYCSIVKFTTNSIPTATAVTVKGMKNTVSVNFGANNAAASTPTLGNNPYTPGQSGDGDIILHAESTTERWAILLEQDEASGATVTASGYNNSTCNVPKISNNTYNNSGVGIAMTTTITWNSSTVNGIKISNSSFTNSGIKVTSNSSNAKWNYSSISSIDLKNTSDKLTFSTADGTIKKIVITLDSSSGSVDGTLSSGWSYVGLPYFTLTWTDDSSSSVDLSGDSSKAAPGGTGGIIGPVTSVLKVSAITKVEFTVLK